MMIMNGGGLFEADGTPNCVTDRNIESMDVIREMVSLGIIDRGSVSYTTDNLNTRWSDRKVAIGFNSAALLSQAAAVKDELEVNSPIAGAHGDKAALHFVNGIMMYTDTPSQEASEAFMTYYFKNIHQYWDAGLVGGVPVLKSITESAAFKASPSQVKIVTEYTPISTTYAAKGAKLLAGLAAVDGGQPLTQFAQTMLWSS